MREDAQYNSLNYRTVIVSAVLLLIIMFLVSLNVGRYEIPLTTSVKIILSQFFDMERLWNDRTENVVMLLRLPRILAAVVIGTALALSGASYQSVFKNPLVAPDILGVSTGASVGASLSILAGLDAVGIQTGAFTGGLVAVGMATVIPKIIGRNSIMMLVLAGIITGGVMGSLLGIIKYLADTETQLPAITYWQMGSLADVQWQDLVSSGIPIIVCAIIMFLLRWQMNILTLSEEEAHMMIIKPKRIRNIVILCATVLTASSVCICGNIGWIGLVIPHFSRIIAGSDNRKILPLAGILGAIFLLFTDTLSRSITGSEIPLSILTGLIGAPFYFYLLIRQRLKLS